MVVGVGGEGSIVAESREGRHRRTVGKSCQGRDARKMTELG